MVWIMEGRMLVMTLSYFLALGWMAPTQRPKPSLHVPRAKFTDKQAGAAARSVQTLSFTRQRCQAWPPGSSGAATPRASVAPPHAQRTCTRHVHVPTLFTIKALDHTRPTIQLRCTCQATITEVPAANTRLAGERKAFRRGVTELRLQEALLVAFVQSTCMRDQ